VADTVFTLPCFASTGNRLATQHKQEYDSLQNGRYLYVSWIMPGQSELSWGQERNMKNVFKFPIHVRFRDIDGMGHVNNAVFFTYFAEGRLAFFQKITSGTDFSTFSFILAHISCDYLRPVTLNTRVLLEIWVKDIGSKSFGLGYKLLDLSNASITYAKGASVQVFYDYGENKPIAVSPALKQKLIEHL
jgi:acyl-CoA thioester hydrolase